MSPEPMVARANNPMFVPMPARNDEMVWERAVDVVHDYRFEIERKNKLDGVIETQYRVGSGLLEPWHRDSIGIENRLESSLQSIRRRAFVSVTPTEGGYLVGVEVHKELEDLAGVAANSAGGATFEIDQPLRRDLSMVLGQSRPSGWISQGRDVLLERDMLSRLQATLSR
jgi:hypothetical protein